MSPNYQTRPSKYVERKIFIESLQHLRNAGYKISKYHYLGFGSIYYVDFILFNRFLSIKKMTCLEHDLNKPERMKFNKPFKFIQLHMEDIIDYLPQVKDNVRYIVWLDYESKLNNEVLSSIGSLVGTLMNGSILIVTVNANSDLLTDVSSEEKAKKIESIRNRYETGLAPFSGEVKKSDISKSGLPLLFLRSIRSRIVDALRGRLDDDFHQIFNYVYQDGQRMLTFGGIIDNREKKKEILEALKDLKYINIGSNPKKISIPHLTAREKLLLDQKINKNKTVGKLPFELTPEEIEAYVEYANHYPLFHEISLN